MMQNIEKCTVYLISDSVGDTAQKMVMAVTAQYPSIDFSDIKRISFVRDADTLQEALEDAREERALVAITLVNRELASQAVAYCREHGLLCADLMASLSHLIESHFEVEPLQEPGRIHRMNEEYFNRVAAIEFAVRYDDGKSPKGFLKADMVILGVSRTSKTPLSMYLANQKYKVANLPLIPEVPLPEEIYEVDPRRLFGLTADPEVLLNIRLNRLRALGLQKGTSYTDAARIREELDYSQKLFEALGAQVIDVSHRSIEETAVLIEERLQDSI